ncbi:hypothetical protein PIB30_010852 [Stylosanthes scabra]|uniref:Uncharacterized protein n=1 Tax=Stylosanthes scabra TaxID=79078 RepID=A0ABU6R6X8_9FABA|nr:hypothetical protein [Stylosanthes scabra]
MRIQSWLQTCSNAANTATHQSTILIPNKKHQHHDHASHTTTTTTSYSSGSEPLSSSSQESSSSSTPTLCSDLSIQTLPSVPSLQKLTPQSLNFSVSHHCQTTLTREHSRPVTSLAVHGHLLYAATAHQINVYDLNTCATLQTLNSEYPSSGSTKAITFCNGMVFTTHQDCKIRVWHFNKHRMLTALPTINDRLRRFLLPKNYVTVRRHQKRLWIEHADAVTGLAVSEVNDFIYSVSWDKTLKVWRVSDLRCLESVKAHEDAVNAVAVSKDGTVYTGSADRRIRVWAKPNGEKRHALVATLEKHRSAVNALALNDDGSILFSGACDRSILVWEREDSANHMVVCGALRGHHKAILCLINVSDLLLSGSADRTVRVWKRAFDGQFCCLAVLEGHRKPVKSLAAAVQESHQGEDSQNDTVSIFSGSLDGEIKIWKVSLASSLPLPPQKLNC